MKSWAATLLLAAAALMPGQSAVSGEAEIVAELQRQIVRCWAPPAETSASETPVTLTFALNRDGALTNVPTIVENPAVLEYGKQFVASAARAIKACAPYHLPPEDYDIWKVVKITFNPPEL